MVKSPLMWLSALWLGVMVHLDWHFGRHGDHLSFNLAYHWLLAVPAFAPIPWLARRRWGSEARRAGWTILIVGVLLGQGLEPLGEVLLFPVGIEPLSNPVRWQIFATFLVAGLVVFLLVEEGFRRYARESPRKVRPA